MSHHEPRTDTDESDHENTSRRHGGPIANSTGSVQGIKDEELSVGDVVVVDRSVGSIDAQTYATVVSIDERGSRLVGPDYPSAAFGAALDIVGVTSYDRLVGRDGDGAYHLLCRSPGGDRLLEVIEDPGEAPVHEQRIVSDRVLAQWVEHIGDVRGWDSVTSAFAALVDGVDRGDGVRTDGGHSGGGSVYVDVLGILPTHDDEVICSNCRRPRFTWEKCPNCGHYADSVGQKGDGQDVAVRSLASDSEQGGGDQ
jgi:hypothetical protein